MVITVTCPSCSSSFPVDPAKIPEGGVNARCTQCSDIFRVEKPAPPAPEPVVELPGLPDPVPMAPQPPAPAPAPAPATFEAPPQPSFAAPPEPAPPALDPTPAFSSPPPASDPFAEAAPFEIRREAPPAAPPQAAPTPPAEPKPVQGFTFGKRDPTDKAKRLARVLVSDMIMYNAERHQSALAGGTLVEDFEEEIQKSWKEYVDQVGEEMANGPGRQFWSDALNDILAKGRTVF